MKLLRVAAHAVLMCVAAVAASAEAPSESLSAGTFLIGLPEQYRLVHATGDDREFESANGSRLYATLWRFPEPLGNDQLRKLEERLAASWLREVRELKAEVKRPFLKGTLRPGIAVWSLVSRFTDAGTDSYHIQYALLRGREMLTLLFVGHGPLEANVARIERQVSAVRVVP